MLETTLAKVLKGKLTEEETAKTRLYLVKEDDTIFYIGLSISPVNRLLEHTGMIGRGASELGDCIYHNLPHSVKWTVQLYTLDDCLLYVTMYNTMDIKLYIEESKNLNRAAMEAAEDALIMHYHPCLNYMKNPKPTLLPERYEWRVATNPYADKIATALGLDEQ